MSRPHTNKQIAEALTTGAQWRRCFDTTVTGAPFWTLIMPNGGAYWFASNDIALVDFTIPGMSDETDPEKARAMALEHLTGEVAAPPKADPIRLAMDALALLAGFDADGFDDASIVGHVRAREVRLAQAALAALGAR